MNDDAEPEGTVLTAADAAWLEAALQELSRGETPPDLRMRVLTATPAQCAEAAARVEAASPSPKQSWWWAAAVVLFGTLVVTGVVALQRHSATVPTAAPQQPGREIEVTDVENLAAHLRRAITVGMRALQAADGARLPNEPEHEALVSDVAWLRALQNTVVVNAAASRPFPAEAARAELLVAAEEGFVRLRLAITDEAVRLGAARFSLAAPLPAELATKIRAEWQRLATRKPRMRQRMQVHTQRQLIAAIGSDRTIELVGGPFVLTGSDDEGELPANPAVEFRDPSPVPFLVLKGVRNLRLCAVGGPVRVLGRSPVDVLRCEKCTDVSFEGLVLGHDTGVEHHCVAPVLTLQDCQNVVVRDCELFGCGTKGIVAERVEGFRMERGEIHTCRDGVAQFAKSRGIVLHGVVVRDSGCRYSAFGFLDCEQVVFTDCVVRGLDAGRGGAEADDDALFYVTGDEAVRFVRGAIRGNRTNRIANSKLLLVREGTDERDNGPAVQVPRSGGR